MNNNDELIYAEKGLLAPNIVRIIGYVLIPLLATGASLILAASFYTQEWWLLLLAAAFFILGLLPIFGLNSVELWISENKLTYKENPFNLFPKKPISISGILYVEIVPQVYRYLISYHIVILTNVGNVSFVSTNSHDEAIEITQIINSKLASFHLSTGNI